MPRGITGGYVPLLPIDMLILDFLPPEGSTFAGIYPIGETVRAMVNKIGKGQVKSSTFSARVRNMHIGGLVTQVQTVGGSGVLSWQITAAGQKQLAEWKGASGE